MPVAAVDRPLETRLIEAMLECIGRWGVAKTTADDIARTAGVSRATLYRAFPGGKEVAFESLLRHETGRFFEQVSAQLDDCETLEDLLVTGAVEAADFLLNHAALGFVVRHEPELLLPAVAFQQIDGALAIACEFVVPRLGRFVPDAALAAAGAELVVRLLLSYALHPSQSVDLTDPESVRRFVRTFVLPVLTPKEP
jgi:AcrR family transcriptional regulator